MTTIGPRLSNDYGDSNEKDKKKNPRHLVNKTATLHDSRRCTTATGNFLISRARFKEYLNTRQKVSFSFSKLRYGPFELKPV